MTAAAKLAAAALILAVLYTAVKTWLPAYAPIIGIAGAAAMLAVLQAADGGELRMWADNLKAIGGQEAFSCLFKSVGIILLADYSKNLCKDAGLASVGVCVEFCGRCLVLLTAWPIFSGVFQMIEELAA